MSSRWHSQCHHIALHYKRLVSIVTQGICNAPHRKRFPFDKNVAKKVVNTSLRQPAACRGHSASRPNYNHVVFFRKSTNAGGRRAGGIAMRCVALQNPCCNDGKHYTRLSPARARCTIIYVLVLLSLGGVATSHVVACMHGWKPWKQLFYLSTNV